MLLLMTVLTPAGGVSARQPALDSPDTAACPTAQLRPVTHCPGPAPDPMGLRAQSYETVLAPDARQVLAAQGAHSLSSLAAKWTVPKIPSFRFSHLLEPFTELGATLYLRLFTGLL